MDLQYCGIRPRSGLGIAETRWKNHKTTKQERLRLEGHRKEGRQGGRVGGRKLMLRKRAKSRSNNMENSHWTENGRKDSKTKEKKSEITVLKILKEV